MTLTELISQKEGVFVLYWYDLQDELVSRVCYPEVVSDDTVVLLNENIETMADRNLFCLVYEELSSNHVYVFNKGALINTDKVFIKSDDLSVSESDKRMFYRYGISTDLVLMNKHHHERVKLNNISYTGVNITTDIPLKMGEEIMLYDPSEVVPVYIPGEVVYIERENNYGIMICGNYDHINRIVVPKII